jgi:hypothetical protein
MRQGVYNELRSVETLIALAADVDPETAELHRTGILPDERRHAAIGKRALTLLCDTPAAPAGRVPPAGTDPSLA